ncbi:hypothetical protein GGS24DRAFT_450473, partial [Hypoxylon argillaceum]
MTAGSWPILESDILLILTYILTYSSCNTEGRRRKWLNEMSSIGSLILSCEPKYLCTTMRVVRGASWRMFVCMSPTTLPKLRPRSSTTALTRGL